MPVMMLTRCIVVAGATTGKQSAREKKQRQSVLPVTRTGFALRIKNVFMHIQLPGVTAQASSTFPQE